MMTDDTKTEAAETPHEAPAAAPAGEIKADAGAAEPQDRPAEVGGPEGPEPTRYGDWEKKGRCIDF